jgi:hypothetical protein
MSFFDRQGIPETLIQSQYKMGDWDKSHGDDNRSDRDEDDAPDSRSDNEFEGDQRSDRDKDDAPDSRSDDDQRSDRDEDGASDSESDNEFENDIMMLRQYYFLSIGVDGTTFEMHGLVQLAMRKWLEKHGQLERWKQKYIRKLFEEFPTGEHENWQKCSVLFPHAKGAIIQKPKGEDSIGEWATLLYHAAWYAWTRGIIADAESLLVKSMNARNKLFGLEHEKTLSSMAMVGLVYTLRGRLKEAEELELQVMETKKRVLSEEHPNTLTSMNNLALTY